MADAVGNVHVALYVDTGQTRRFTTAAGIIDRDSQRIRTALGGTSKSVTHLQQQMGQNMRVKLFGNMLRDASQANNELSKLRATMLGLAALTGTSVSGAFAATWLLQTADRAKLLHNQLRTVTNSSEELLATQRRLYALSQESRSSMEGTVRLYSRLARAAEFFGMKQEDIVRVTETVQKAFAVGGASQAEAWGAAVQLSQGIASDRFSGEEYRSVAENAPVLLQEMAKGLGITIGQLREMAHAGELTGKVVAEAILGASAAIDADFKKTSVTVGQAMTRVGNAFLMYVGKEDQALGVTGKLSAALSGLADHFEEIAYWGSMIAGLGLAAFGGKILSSGTKGVLAAVVPTKADRAAIRQELRNIAAQRMALNAEIASAQGGLVTHAPMSGIGPTRPDAFGRAIAGKQQPLISHAMAEEERARVHLNSLQVAHLIATDKITAARAEGLKKLQADVAAARQRNALDGQRVGLTQKAVAAEMDVLRAKQQQALVANTAKMRQAIHGDFDAIRAVEAERDRILSTPLTSGTLEKRVAADTRAMATFDKSLGTLQSRMRELAVATTTAFDNPATRKLAGEISGLDRQIIAAQARIAAATHAVTAAYTADARTLAVADAERAAAVAHVNSLQTQANRLTAQATGIVNRLTFSTKALAAAQRVGGSVLNFLGGWTGVAFLAAIAGISYFGGEAAKAQERSERLKKELNELGLVSDKTAGIVEMTAQSIEDLATEEVVVKLAELRAEIERLRGSQGIFDKLFAYDPLVLGNMQAEISGLLNTSLGRGQVGTRLDPMNADVAGKLADIIDAVQADAIDADVLSAKLDMIANESGAELDARLASIIANLRMTAEVMAAAETRSAQLAAAFDTIQLPAWMQNQADKNTMGAADQGALEWLATLQSISDEMVRQAGLSEDDARLESVTDGILKEWAKINDEKGLSTALSREMAEAEARLVIAAEDGADAEKERLAAVVRSNEAIAKYRDSMIGLSAEIAAVGNNLQDQGAADHVRTMISQFMKGKLHASELKSRLEGIAGTNISAGMIALIGKIQAAIPIMATLLRLFRMMPGATIGEAVMSSSDRVRAYGAAKGVTAKANADMLAESGMSADQIANKAELDALMRGPEGGVGMSEEDAKAFQSRLLANRQSVEDLSDASKEAASNAEKFAEGMAELQRELALAPLDDFYADVASKADSMGIASDEIDAFVAAVSAGGLDAAPEKFRKIAAAMQEIGAVQTLKDLSFDMEQLARSDVNQSIAEKLRDLGISVESSFGKMISAQMKFIEGMKFAKGIVTGFVQDIFSGFSKAMEESETDKEAARLKYAGELLQQAQEAGTAVTAQQRREIAGLAREMANAEYGATNMERAQKALWTSIQDASISALERIGAKTAEMAADALFGMLLKTVLGSFGGASIGGGVGSSLATGASSVFGGIDWFAKGTNSAPGGLAMIGEDGPELVNLNRGAQVFTAEQTARMLSSPIDSLAMPAGATAQARMILDVFVNDDGTLGAIARRAGREGGAEAADVRVHQFSKHELPDRLEAIGAQPRKRG